MCHSLNKQASLHVLLSVTTFALVLTNIITALPTERQLKLTTPGLTICTICQSFSDDQRTKIKARKRYHSKKDTDKADTSQKESEF